MNQAEALMGMIEGLKRLDVVVTIRRIFGGMTEVALYRDVDVDVNATGGTTGEALGAALELCGDLAVTAAVVTAAHVGEPVPVPVDAIRKLRQMLSDEGEYSILRDDGEPMELGEILMIGIVLEEIDTWLNAQGGAQ